MKISELKHNHSLTDLLKILIFSILMLTPLLSVATRCLYVVCNKNAYLSNGITSETIESVTPNYKYQTNEVDDSTDLVTGNVYHFGMDDFLFTDDYNWDYYIEFIPIDDLSSLVCSGASLSDSYLDEYSIYSPIQFGIQFNSGGASAIISTTQVMFLEIETSYFMLQGNFLISFDESIAFDNDFYSLLNISICENVPLESYTINYTDSSTLDNVFEYSISQLESSEYYNWTQSTAIYTGVKAMSTNLQINGNVIPMLITYWFLLTVIYVIIDIVLKCFTTLTHLIGNKIT